jgi:hypothetical protein
MTFTETMKGDLKIITKGTVTGTGNFCKYSRVTPDIYFL